MKKNNIKKNYTDINSINARRAEAEALCRARRTSKLKAAGITEDQLKQLTEDENARSILCMYYGSYTVNLGEKTIKVKKYNKKIGGCEEVEVTKEVILRGRAAAEHFINEQKYNVVVYKPTHCYIATTKDKVDEIVEVLREKIGRCFITKHDNLTVSEVLLKFHPEKEQEKKPTNNTPEVKKEAKEKRKKANKKKANMAPFYAAYRKGGVSKRIKKFNKTLAEKIEKWLKEKKAAEASRTKGTKEERAKHRQLTSLEMKANKRARKAAKRLAAKERRMTAEKKRADYNAKQRAKRLQKAQKPVQTELKMAA